MDDDDDVRKSVSRLLRRAGCQVALAASGQECLRLLGEGFRGLILMDIMMPGMDGWATMRAIGTTGCWPGT